MEKIAFKLVGFAKCGPYVQVVFYPTIGVSNSFDCTRIIVLY